MTSAKRAVLWGRVLTGGHELPPTRVVIGAGRIEAMVSASAPEPADEVIEEGWIAPGLIDVQVNGAAGEDLTSASDPRAALAVVARALAAHGVTAFCPTIVSSPRELIVARLAAFGPQSPECGAEVLGLHIEGPFIDREHRGVHNPNVIRAPSEREIDAWLADVRFEPAIVTLAPEHDTEFQTIKRLARAGVVVSVGHSGADAATTQAAVGAGARMATHLFNAMPPLHHRQPGLVGAALAGRLVVGLIADGIHVHPLLVDLVVRRCGVERVMLVSDALASAGMPPGEYALGDQQVISDGRSVRRADGTLAGCAMLLDGCLRNVRGWLPDMSAARLIQMVTQTPADLLGVTRKGRVAVGCDADLVVLDADFNVRQTWLRGERVVR